jgi:hypothetical protein
MLNKHYIPQIPQLKYVAYHSPSHGQLLDFHLSLFRRLQILEIYSFLLGLSLSAPDLDEILIARIKEGGTAKAAFDGVNNAIDSMIIPNIFLL